MQLNIQQTYALPQVMRTVRWLHRFTILFYIRPISGIMWEFMVHRGVTLPEKGWIYGIALTTAAVAAPVSGVLADRFGYRRMLVIGSICDLIFALIYTFGYGWGMLAIGSTFFVLGNTACFGPLKSFARLVGKEYAEATGDPNFSARLLAARQARFVCGMALGAGTSGLLLWLLGGTAGRLACATLAVALALGAILCSLKLEEPPRDALQTTPRVLLTFWRTPFTSIKNGVMWIRSNVSTRVRLLLAFGSISALLSESVAIWQQPYLHSVGVSPVWISICMGANQLLWSVAGHFRSKWWPHFGRKFWPLVCMGLIPPIVLIVISSVDTTIGLVAIVPFAIGLGWGDLVYIALERAVPERISSTISSILSVLVLVQAALYSVWAGGMMQGGDQESIQHVQLLTGITIGIIVAPLLIMLYRRPK